MTVKKYLVTKWTQDCMQKIAEKQTSSWRSEVAHLGRADGIFTENLPSDSDITELHGASVQGERYTYWIHLIP